MQEDFFSMRIEPEEKRKLMAMARATARTGSGLIRWWIKKEWDRFSLTEEGQQALEDARESSTTE